MQYAWAADIKERGYDDQADGILEWKVVYRCSALAARGTKHNAIRLGSTSLVLGVWLDRKEHSNRPPELQLVLRTLITLHGLELDIRRPENRRRSNPCRAGGKKSAVYLPGVPGFQQCS